MIRVGRYAVAGAVGCALIGAVLAGAVDAYSGRYGFNVLLKRGGSYWAPVAQDSADLPESMRLALGRPSIEAIAGPFHWNAIAAGFEVGEMPVLAEGLEVDRLMLARVDPAQFRFEALNAPAGDKELADWMADPRIVLAINGSYYSRYGLPDTPFLSNGRELGPAHYEATHGAFVAGDSGTGVRDLKAVDWTAAFAGAHDAMVSYPLLLDADGSSRAGPDTGWLANRSFVAQDAEGWIVLGTTKNAFFSLARLAAFLRTAPLRLVTALNLDGGPVACQGIALNGFSRRVCGRWELSLEHGQARLLTFGFGRYGTWALPIVLAVVRR